jgi:hypothetical protein
MRNPDPRPLDTPVRVSPATFKGGTTSVMPREQGLTTWRPSRLLFVVGVGLLFLWRPAAAAFIPSIRSQPITGGVQVVVSGRAVASVRAPEAELLPLDRAERFVLNLRLFLEGGGTGWQVRPAPYGGQSWAVYGGEMPLFIVTPREAKAHGSTPRALARLWARALRTTLNLPSLTLSRTQVVVPYGEQRTVTIGGVARGELTATPGDPQVVEAATRATPRAVVLRGLAPGLTAVRVEADGAAITLSVRVMKYAASLAPAPVAEVTGRPAPAALVEEVAIAAHRDGLRLEPGARVRLLRAPQAEGKGGLRPPRALAAGEEATLVFPVSVTGPGYLPVETRVRVAVRNRRLPPQETHALLYSNKPEQVQEPRVLYLGAVEPDAPARLLYHHVNSSSGPLRLNVDVYNPGSEIAQLQVIAGTAGPALQPVTAGHQAGLRFLQASMREVGRILTVPPGARRSLLLATMQSGQTVSGLFGLRVLSVGRLLVRVAAEAVHERPGSLAATVRELSPEVYLSPRKEVEATYRVGEQWAFVNLGRRPIAAREGDGRLAGNYGVLYDISLTLENPLDVERKVRLVLSPDAGTARGVFLIDGQLIEAPPVVPPEEALLTSITMKPAERRTLKIRAMPVGGSAYPVSLVVRP